MEEMHRYLGGTLRELGATPLIVGGTSDHVHLLFGFKSNQCIADLVRETKKASTNWMHGRNDEFYWQEGYGAFTVSPERLEVVTRYIQRQEKHHQKKTFREEFIELLRYARVEFDESMLD